MSIPPRPILSSFDERWTLWQRSWGQFPAVIARERITEDHIKQIKAGDFVVFDGDLIGRVAFSSISHSYSKDYPESDWMKNEGNDGIMIVQKNGARIFYERSFFEDGEVQIRSIEEPNEKNYGSDFPELGPQYLRNMQSQNFAVVRTSTPSLQREC